MKKIFATILASVEKAPLRYSSWAISFTSLIGMRILVDNWVSGFPQRSASFFLFEFTHTFLFFLFAYLLLLPLLRYFTKTSLIQSTNILLFGFLIILTPPLVDTWVLGAKGFWSFYKFDGLLGLWYRFLTLFGDKPEIGITYGVRFEVALVTLLIGYYTFLKTKRVLRALSASITAYALLFILGTFPSWIAIVLVGIHKGFIAVNEIDIAHMFFSPPLLFSRLNVDVISSLNIKMSLVYIPFLTFLICIELWRYFPKIFLALLGNLRFPQMIYHGGLVCVGASMAFLFSQTSPLETLNFFSFLSFFTVIVAVEFAWIASTIINDIFDEKTDILTNKNRPLPQNAINKETYKAIGITFFFFSLFFSLIIHPLITFFLLLYQCLAWIYSAWPLRLKRFPIIATFISAIACILVLISGFILVSPDQNLQHIPTRIFILLIIALTCSLPLKDFKDIAGDKADQVYTIPVLFGEYWGKIIIGSMIFLSYLLSIPLLHEFRLFWWAILFGGISFWIIFFSHSGEKGWMRFRLLPGWILIPITLYGLLVAKYIL